MPPDGPTSRAALLELYWQDLARRPELQLRESADYVRRLRAAVPLGPSARVLDFGCGFGVVGRALAPDVAEVALWDSSAAVRAFAARFTEGLSNVSMLDDLAPSPPPAGTRFDLVLVNSVVQYMDAGELPRWLVGWRTLLAPGGRVVLSDLIASDHGIRHDVVALIRFGWEDGCLRQALGYGLGELSPFRGRQAVGPLLRVDRGDLEGQARAAGLEVEVLPHNLTYKGHRWAAVLRRVHER